MIKSSQLFLLLAMVIFAVDTQAQLPLCPVNEVFTKCGTYCPPTCDERGMRPCNRMCFVGCECVPGYLRNSMNECVDPSEC